MNEQKFAELVKKRAHKVVQDKLTTFKQEVENAFSKLTGERWFDHSEGYKNSARGTNYAILKAAHEHGDFDLSGKWPAWLWKTEEEKVMKDILSTMDTMQKALIAPEIKDTDCLPAE